MENRINYYDFIKLLAKHTNYAQRNIQEVLKGIEELVTENLANGTYIKITPSISFSVTERGAREGRNPITGEIINLPPRRTVKTTIAPKMKEAIQKH